MYSHKELGAMRPARLKEVWIKMCGRFLPNPTPPCEKLSLIREILDFQVATQATVEEESVEDSIEDSDEGSDMPGLTPDTDQSSSSEDESQPQFKINIPIPDAIMNVLMKEPGLHASTD